MIAKSNTRVRFMTEDYKLVEQRQVLSNEFELTTGFASFVITVIIRCK